MKKNKQVIDEKEVEEILHHIEVLIFNYRGMCEHQIGTDIFNAFRADWLIQIEKVSEKYLKLRDTGNVILNGLCEMIHSMNSPMFKNNLVSVVLMNNFWYQWNHNQLKD